MNMLYNQNSSDLKAQNEFGPNNSTSDDQDSTSVTGPVASKPGNIRNRFQQEFDAAPDDTNVSAVAELDSSEGVARVLYGSIQAKDSIIYNDVADFFLAYGNETGDPVTNLRLQKLVYYAQAWYLANYEKPLFSAEFEAWVHGPVIPELYHEYKVCKSHHIETELSLEKVERRFDDDTLDFLREMADVYMPFTTYHLERMTHLEEPWIAARGGLPADAVCNNIIPKQSMSVYYAKRLKETD